MASDSIVVQGCVGCYYYTEDGTCLHPWRINCKNSLLWTPKNLK